MRQKPPLDALNNSFGAAACLPADTAILLYAIEKIFMEPVRETIWKILSIFVELYKLSVIFCECNYVKSSVISRLNFCCIKFLHFSRSHLNNLNFLELK